MELCDVTILFYLLVLKIMGKKKEKKRKEKPVLTSLARRNIM
jgi:hypothetical protein